VSSRHQVAPGRGHETAIPAAARGLRSRGQPFSLLIKGRRRRLAGLVLACAGVLVLAACAGTAAPSSVTGKPVQGGTANYAMGVGDTFSWIFPLDNQANWEPYEQNIENGMWRPLYYPGGPGTSGIDYSRSLAYPPVYSNHDQTVTITMRRDYKWSDGTPVTTKDVQFWFQIEAAGVKLGKYAPYVSGEIPDDIKSVTYNGPYKFTIQLKRSYNPVWFTGNQLLWIFPLPRQAWDRTCATCPVGNDAATLAGAEKVYNFLYSQSEKLTTYATNPIWKVVDGPWVIHSFDPTTYHTVLCDNKAYTGPYKPRLACYGVYSFNSDTAELDAVRSGQIQFGWLPFSDVAALKTYEGLGFTFKPWYAFYNEDIEFGYTSKQWGPLVSQLYIRQALQHLVNEPLYIKTALHGYGLYEWGMVPVYPSPYVSPMLKHPLYPYSVSAARALLTAHGWVKNSSGVDVCERPGTGASDCGAGIAKGTPLSLLFMYSTGSPSFLAQVEAFATAAKQVGVNITLDGQTTDTMYSIAGVCPPGPCKWGMAGYAGFMWDYGQSSLVPSGMEQFGKGNYWAGGWNSPTAQKLGFEAHTQPGLAPLYRVENYISQQVASLWWPVPPQYLLLVKNNLKGWLPLNPYVNPMPSRWYYVK
jgi:peptide/nickel transport system substrate-binding protein